MLAEDQSGAHLSGSPAEAEDVEQLRVTLAQAGDAEVWESWFDEHYAKLYQYAYFRLRRRADAEDLVGQVFLEAVRGISGYRYQGRPILAWLYRIAHNLIYDRLKRESSQSERLAASALLSGTETNPEERIENIDLLLALEELTDEQREVVILRFFLAMPAKEVAELLGKTETAVFSLQARALMTLREKLGDLPSL